MLSALMLSRYNNVICTNSYSLHSENMICAMMTDIRPNVRMRAVGKLWKCKVMLCEYLKNLLLTFLPMIIII